MPYIAVRPRRSPTYKDPLMLHPCVVAYRLRFRLTPNEGFRREIALTTDPEGREGVRLWNDILNTWQGDPKNIKGMMNRFEYLLETENTHARFE